MLCSYYLTDAMAPLQERLEIALNWGATDYGIYTGGYGWFNVFLFMLIIAGMILDKLGIRFTGILAITIMLLGAGIKYWAISGHVSRELVNIHIFNLELFSASKQALVAGLGFAVFGVGCEMFGITANKAVIRWFKGKEMALAIGLNTTTGRIGTALAMFTPVPLVRLTGNISAPVILAMFLLCVGLLAFTAFIMYDKKLDKEKGGENDSVTEDEKFRLSDIVKITKVKAFWYITILCVLFYSAVFPFIKYATNLIVQKFGISDEFAGYIPALLPLTALFLTPFFGGLYDKKGKGATIMVIGSVILLGVHLLFSIPSLNNLYIAIALVMLLGIAFSLVPSAMWPSVAKIIPEKRLGTAYSITFWVQNWGLMGVPMLIGYLLDKYCITGTMEKVIDGNVITVTQYNYTLPMLVFACFGALSIFFALLLKRENAKKGYGLQQPNINH
jgi:nitrate/nitrite transporter NarK